jgi:hypothetical protein
MANRENSFRCGAKPTQWCMNPTTQHGLKSTSQQKWLPIDHDGKIKIIYNKTASGEWTQTTFNMKTGKKIHDTFVNGKGALKE